MARRRLKVNKFDYTNLTANDVLCPVCRTILIRPITLPCTHGFCASCLEETSLQDANQVCPLCSVRVGSWLRSATKSNRLVNETFWQAIQHRFPQQVKNKLDGGSEDKVQPVNKDQEQASFLNNYANKEYTCRFLCQEENIKPEVKSKINPKNEQSSESLTLIQKKNKRIQKITESEERSNSIDSECLYFKPIEYRNNPSTKGSPPIKVPTKKLNVDPEAKISAPCGKKDISIGLISAFAKLFTPIIVIEESDEEEAREYPETIAKTDKRKVEKPKANVTNRRTIRKRKQNGLFKKKISPKLKETITRENNRNNLKNTAHLANRKTVREKERDKHLQEKADFEFAKALQKQFNQYSTRSAARTNSRK